MPTKRPACTVVIPCYNYAHTLERALKSVQSQIVQNFECIVVDDGSKDNPIDVFTKTVGDDKRFKFIRQENAGVANARNKGVFAGTGKYVCCMDADDAIDPRFLYACIKELEIDPTISIAYTGLYFKTPDGKEGLSQWPKDSNYDEQLLGKNQIPTCNVARRVVWERLGGQRQRYAPLGAGEEDAEMWLRMGAYGFRAKKVAEAGLFIYSWMSGRVSGNKEHRMVDYRTWHPWTRDSQHPFMSIASPMSTKLSHAVRQYDEPVVSVIIPVGKGHEVDVVDALDSLDAQTYRKWEAIVIWDTKSDPSYILRTFPYIRFVDLRKKGEPPFGAGYARNRGVESARGGLILFLDADDWLYPEAIEMMIDAWETESDSIIYTDYVGKSIIDEELASSARREDRLLDYDPKTGRAVIAYNSKTYNCEMAIAQPNQDMYHWCIVTMLMRKTFHDDIGGFDENMESWEDWDYQIRLARAGKCFLRLAEQLVVYRFYSGNRRQYGIDNYPDLVKYMKEKYREVQVMGCGCGGNRAIQSNQAVYAGGGMMASPQNGGISTMDDKNFKLITYRHPNSGQHRVIGSTTQIDYGYRGGGEKFLVHIADIEANKTLFDLAKVDFIPEPESKSEPTAIAKDFSPKEEEFPEPKPVEIQAPRPVRQPNAGKSRKKS